MINLLRIVTKVRKAIRFLLSVYRSGGYSTVKVQNVSCGDRLDGKRVLITGGGSGIGLCIARNCLNEGAYVVITGRNESKLMQAKSELDSPYLKTLVWDVGNIKEINSRLAEVRSLFDGDIDVLVNNAGVMSVEQFGGIEEVEWDNVYAVNSKAVFFLTQAIVKEWTTQPFHNRYKKILNISSQGGFIGAVYPYRMTKWDVAGLTKGLGLLLAPKGIIVNGIAPGIVATDMQAKAYMERDNLFTNLNPINRVALPEEIAELALFLISDSGNFIVGQTIICDGGYTLK